MSETKTQQQQHAEQTIVSGQQHCNLHKGVVGKQQQQHQQLQQQQQHLHYQKQLQLQEQQQHHHYQPQMRPETQQQQQQQQYQNIGTWLPQNKPIPTATTGTTNMNGKIDDLKPHRHHEQQTHYHHQQQQQQLQSNYCSKRLDSNIANGRNTTCLIEDVESDFMIGKTFITPPDIPSPPPQPILSDNKRFQSGQTPNKTTAMGASTPAALINKSCCQCEGRVKNLSFSNHTPLAQHHSSHCHLHQQPPKQQQQQLHHTPHHNNLQHQYQQQHQQQQQHQLHSHNQHNNEETLILPKATSALKSQQQPHYHNQQPHHQQQQQYHHHSSSLQQHQQHYRKVDVFAAASIDDDDNDTSPSIKVKTE
ncbi:hypothetical protein FF38_11983 [Lucilia cuprina]|uniref:Uncharacterized protein n=1 Tax=Lucilia cuprina TaxID=7375 RepID=A0A0L0CDW4_LUCCU|nr:hypothetical protein FF38_11983 [Lucilia cuprina]